MIEKILPTINFLLIAIGVGIILRSLSRLAPHPLQFIAEIIRVLVSELNTERQHEPVEKINLLIMVLFFILSALALLFELAPSGLRQAVGLDVSSSFPYASITCISILVAACILSPLFLIHQQKEQKTHDATIQSLEILDELDNGSSENTST